MSGVDVAVPADTGEDPVPTTTPTQGGEARFGGLTPKEASERAAQARAARRALEEGTTSQKIARAFDRLSQSDWDRAVKGALGSASGMQALTRLLDRVAGSEAAPDEEEGTLTPAERQAALDVLRGMVAEAGGEGMSPSTSPKGESSGEAGRGE